MVSQGRLVITPEAQLKLLANRRAALGTTVDWAMGGSSCSSESAVEKTAGEGSHDAQQWRSQQKQLEKKGKESSLKVTYIPPSRSFFIRLFVSCAFLAAAARAVAQYRPFLS